MHRLLPNTVRSIPCKYRDYTTWLSLLTSLHHCQWVCFQQVCLFYKKSLKKRAILHLCCSQSLGQAKEKSEPTMSQKMMGSSFLTTHLHCQVWSSQSLTRTFWLPHNHLLYYSRSTISHHQQLLRHLSQLHPSIIHLFHHCPQHCKWIWLFVKVNQPALFFIWCQK